ncbi:MAG: T9SS type A sorting domain-containing protein, partial [Ignavibacteria bacterium]|nr:T9SS type A sorting domain-containing protein [Ignavibacteria bacterium]
MKHFRLALIGYILFLQASQLFPQWMMQSVPLDSSVLLSIDFKDSLVGCSGGYNFADGNVNGRAVYTTDGGNTWSLAQLPDSTRSLFAMRFVDHQTVYAAAYRNPIHTKQDSEKILKLTQAKYFSHFDFLNSLSANFIASNRVMFMRSTDAGVSWSSYGTLPDSIVYLYGTSFVAPLIGYIIARADTVMQSQVLLLKTTNGGLSWAPLILPIPVDYLSNVLFTDSFKGYAVGSRRLEDTTGVPAGIVLQTTNAGLTWDYQQFPDSTSLWKVFFTDNQTGYLVGTKGNNFEPVPIGSNTRGIVYKTTNAGNTWFLLPYSPDSTSFAGIQFKGNTGFVWGLKYFTSTIVNQELFIARSTDAGITWTRQVIPQVQSGWGYLFDGKMLSEMNVYVCGGDLVSPGLILHTTNGGVTFVEEENNFTLPKEYLLEQNYPNPFNPSTKIIWQAPVGSWQSIKVYDVLGNEVATIVNEEKSAGTYEIDFDASRLSSGVYFYK